MSVDGLGNPLRFILTGGQQHDITQAEELIAGYAGEHVLADKGYDAQEFRRHILELGMMPVIPPRSNRKAPADYDRKGQPEYWEISRCNTSCLVGDICLNFDANPKGKEARIDKFAPLRVTGIVPFQRLVMTEH